MTYQGCFDDFGPINMAGVIQKLERELQNCKESNIVFARRLEAETHKECLSAQRVCNLEARSEPQSTDGGL
jgi:hypothetical protein